MSKVYTKTIEGIKAKFKLMNRGLRRRLKAQGMALDSIDKDDPESVKQAGNMMDEILESCIINETECDEISLGGEGALLKAIIDASNNIGEKAEKN